MNVVFPPSTFSPRGRSAAFTFACLLAAACPAPAFAAGRSGGSAGGRAGGVPVFTSPNNRYNINAADRNLLSPLSQLSSPPAKGYDIVPPAHPSLTSTGPLPGYQIVALGRGRNNRLCLTSTTAGIKGLIMVDTGANTTSLSDSTYHSLLFNAAYKLPTGVPGAVNLNGNRTPLAEAPDFYVASSNLGAVPVCLVPHRFMSSVNPSDGKGQRYDGLMGENILRHYNAIIDCGRLALYLNIDPAKKVDAGPSFQRGGWTRVPMSDIGNNFTVPCVLNGHKFRLIVDTGSPFTNLDRNLLASAQIDSHDLPISSGLFGTQARQAGLVDLDHLQIGDYTATGVQMTSTPQSLAAFDGSHDSLTAGPIVGLLGGDILAKNGAVIDIGNKVLYLKRTDQGKAAKNSRNHS